MFLIILWSNARKYQDTILADMQTRFANVKTFEITWSEQFLESNFSRFFEKSICRSEIEKKYGSDAFVVCIVEGNQTKISDAICRYKKIIGSTDAVYAAMSHKQVNRDITLLFGKNIEDLKQEENYKSAELVRIKKDLEGASKWDNLAQLFYVLNNSINYVVLRNYEKLPNDFDPSIHGDIDLLVEDLGKILWSTNAFKMFPEKKTSVAYYVPFCSGNIQFDFRYLGDNYLDKKWERDILRSARRYTPPRYSDSFVIMSPVNQYFTLLYHAYVQKWKIASDYPNKLRQFAEKIGATYKDDPKYSMLQLYDFMNEQNYHVSIPSEKEGTLNWQNIKYTDEYLIVRLKYFFTRELWFYVGKVPKKLKKILSKSF